MSADSELTPEPTRDVLRVMANPFRARAYDALLIFGDMTARKLATLTSISEASLNLHMRELQRISFVAPLNPDAPVRQRIWHAVPGGVRLGELSETEDYTPEARAWLRSTLQAESQVLQEWIDRAREWPAEWRRAVERYDYVMTALTVEQLTQLSADLNAVGQKWLSISKQQDAEGREHTRAAFVVTHAVPYPVAFDDAAS